MDQLERVRSLLSKVTYKPGWIITAYPHQYFNKPKDDFYRFHDTSEIIIRVVCLQPDTISGRETEIAHHRTIHSFDLEHMKDHQIVEYLIAGAIREMELHEMDEWFKFDGEHVRDPHPKK